MDLSHLRMTADDAEVISIAHQRTLQAPVLTFDSLELQGAFNQHRDLIRCEGFFDVVEGAALDGFDSDIQRAVRSHHDHKSIGSVALDVVQQIYPATIGKA